MGKLMVYFMLILALNSCFKKQECRGINSKGFTHYKYDSLALYELPNGKIYKILLADEEAGWIVELIDSRDDYFKINIPDLELTNLWIKKGLVSLNTRNYDGQEIYLYETPSKSSPILGVLTEEQTVKVLDVCEKWIYIEGVGKYSNKIEGWLEPDMQCANPYTTCN